VLLPKKFACSTFHPALEQCGLPLFTEEQPVAPIGHPESLRRPHYTAASPRVNPDAHSPPPRGHPFPLGATAYLGWGFGLGFGTRGDFRRGILFVGGVGIVLFGGLFGIASSSRCQIHDCERGHRDDPAKEEDSPGQGQHDGHNVPHPPGPLLMDPPLIQLVNRVPHCG